MGVGGWLYCDIIKVVLEMDAGRIGKLRGVKILCS